jgi:hypothetical protein
VAVRRRPRVGVVKAPVFAAVALVALALGFVGSDSSGSNEARPRAVAADCQTVRLPVVVLLDAKDHRHLIAHTHEALELGEPRILHIDGGGEPVGRRGHGVAPARFL